MNAFLNHSKQLLADLLGHSWGTTPFWVTLAVALIVLLFGAGTVARVIFTKDTGLVRTALAAILVMVAAAAAHVGAGMCGAAPLVAYGAAAAAALAAVWLAAKILGTPYGQAFGIMLFAVVITWGAAFGAGKVCGTLVDGAKELEKKQPLDLAK